MAAEMRTRIIARFIPHGPAKTSSGHKGVKLIDGRRQLTQQVRGPPPVTNPGMRRPKLEGVLDRMACERVETNDRRDAPNDGSVNTCYDLGAHTSMELLSVSFKQPSQSFQLFDTFLVLKIFDFMCTVFRGVI